MSALLCAALSREVPRRVPKYGTRPCCVGDSLRQCGSVRIRTSVPCFGGLRYQLAGRPVRPNFILEMGPKRWRRTLSVSLESPKTASASASQYWSRRNRYLSDRLSHEAWHLKRA